MEQNTPTNEELAAELAEVKKQLANLMIAFNRHVHVYRGDRNYKNLTGKQRDQDDQSWRGGV